MWRRSNRWSTKTRPKCVGAAAATAIAASDIEAAAMAIAVSDTEAAAMAIAVSGTEAAATAIAVSMAIAAASAIAAMAIAASATAPSPAARSPGAAITAAIMAAMATMASMAAMAAIPPTATPPPRMAMGAAMAIAAAIARPMTITAGEIRRPASSHLPLEEEVGAAKQRPVPTSMKSVSVAKLVMPGLVPGIHVLAALKQGRRGWPGRSPAMTKKRMRDGDGLSVPLRSNIIML